MRYVLICIICLMVWGCQSSNGVDGVDGEMENRKALIERLQREYPDTWRQELAEHDRQMQRIESATPSPEYGPGFTPDPTIPDYRRSPWAFPKVREY